VTTLTLLTVYSDETDPDTRLAWRDLTGALRNLAAPWTLRAEVVDPDTNVRALNKTTGVTGADGTGLSNVNVAWSAADLAGLTAGKVYRLRVVATNGTEVAVFTLDDRGALPLFRVLAKPT
jgi:hypothetical protein